MTTKVDVVSCKIAKPFPVPVRPSSPIPMTLPSTLHLSDPQTHFSLSEWLSDFCLFLCSSFCVASAILFCIFCIFDGSASLLLSYWTFLDIFFFPFSPPLYFVEFMIVIQTEKRGVSTFTKGERSHTLVLSHTHSCVLRRWSHLLDDLLNKLLFLLQYAKSLQICLSFGVEV